MNGVKVGKDKEHRLEHAVIIAILQSKYDLFRFINEARLKPMYPWSLVDRCLVGRVLGEGASAVKGNKKRRIHILILSARRQMPAQESVEVEKLNRLVSYKCFVLQ